MPRGSKRDLAETAKRNFLDKRSFVSLDGHEYLRGKDMSALRLEVWERDRRCMLAISDHCFGKRLTLEYMQTDHIQGGNVGRCDCLHNLRAVCFPCHQLRTWRDQHH